MLAAAAVVGRSFDFDTVRAASGRGEEETLTALEELTSRGLIREVGSPVGGTPAYDFDHDKLRTLVYEETSLARKRLLHRRAAFALAGQARGRETDALAGQIARHHRLAGQDEEAARYYRLAGTTRGACTPTAMPSPITRRRSRSDIPTQARYTRR